MTLIFNVEHEFFVQYLCTWYQQQTSAKIVHLLLFFHYRLYLVNQAREVFPGAINMLWLIYIRKKHFRYRFTHKTNTKNFKRDCGLSDMVSVFLCAFAFDLFFIQTLP